MKIAIASDKRAIGRKLEVKRFLEEQGHTVIEVVPDENTAVVHTISAPKVCKLVQSGEVDRGILICGTGMGMSMVANKHKGIRAACCESTYAVESCRRINNANVLCMGAFILGPQLACDMAGRFVMTPFAEGFEAEHIAYIKERDADMAKIEEANFKQISKNFNF